MTVQLNAQVKTLTKGKYRTYQAVDAADIRAAQQLRARCFGLAEPIDCDAFDSCSTHVLVRETASDTLVCCYRVHALRGSKIAQSYAAEFYDLSALHSYGGLMMELGRFCVHPDWCDPDILRVAWAALTDFVDANDISMLFGCTSFAGSDPARYLNAFARLNARHLAPDPWMPAVKSAEVFHFAGGTAQTLNGKKAQLEMPPLLRTYLVMGGWVSDHAVFDRTMNTLHVFTGLEIGKIPASRKRLLRALV